MRDTAPAAPWSGRPWPVFALWLGFAGLLAARDPGIVLHATFWAEDGWAWYPDAYHDGLASLVQPIAGYLQTVARVVGLLAQPFPLLWAPTIFAGAALLIQALPPAFLVSSRLDAAFPGRQARLVFALAWIALPNSREVFVNLTNAQWHLAALAFLVVVSRAPAGWPGRMFDAAALIVSGLSGPFCAVLAPGAAWLAWSRRDAVSLWRLAAVLGAAAVQAGFVLTTIHERTAAPLGADPVLLIRITVQQIVAGALLGQQSMMALIQVPLWQGAVLPVLAGLAAAGVTALALPRASAMLRLAVLSALLLFAAAMLRPQVSVEGQQWPPMQIPGVGQRYYYLPMLAWLALVFTLAGQRAWWRRGMGLAMLALFSVAVWRDWSMPPRPRSNMKAELRAFQAAPVGAMMTFTFPPGFAAQPMVLVKKR